MKKLILTSTSIVFILSMTLLLGCSKSPSPPSQLTSTPSPNQTSVVTTSAPSNPADTLQAGLPLTISSPSDGADISGNSVTVTGKTSPGAVVTIGDELATADAQGNFSINVNLDDGPNGIDVIATDNSGATGEVLLLVNASPNTAQPAQNTLPLQVTAPIDGATLNTTSVNVLGQTSPGATVTVNDQTTIADSSGNFAINVPLTSGPNALDVIATDDNGNQNEILLMVNAATGP
ncbi:MAG TPA: hypothetical protein VEH58_06700 [Dehalococcoidales bacterium]|nr:hypothetical protein [Dehalococcoidales bacterium]